MIQGIHIKNILICALNIIIFIIIQSINIKNIIIRAINIIIFIIVLLGVLTQNPLAVGPASKPNFVGSSVKTQLSWVLCQDPRFLGLEFLNIIICVINDIIFLIIQGIHIKNIIICVLNIMIFIIINVKNAIIIIINNMHLGSADPHRGWRPVRMDLQTLQRRKMNKNKNYY
jgi:hypothetical protein